MSTAKLDDTTVMDAPTEVTVWTEAVPATSFHADPRGHVSSILPPEPYIGDLESVPEHVRQSLGKNLRTQTFPYPYAVDSDGSLEPQELTFCSLVSPVWSVVICPSLGGRIMSIHRRGMGAELLWNQPAVRRSVFGLAGAWCIGGVEHNANRLGHQVHGMTRLKTEQLVCPEGHTAVRFGAFDELFASEWSVTVSLLADRVKTRIRFVNHGSRPVPGYWWTNIAVPGSPQIRLMMEPGPLLHHGRHVGFQVSQFPWLNSNDWSEWRNHDDIISAYAFETRDGRMGYLDRGRRFAMVHYASPEACLGRKLWTIGAFHDKVAWWDRLSEPGINSYYEIQCGRRPTQLESDLLEPGQVVEWDEDYSAVALDETCDGYEEQWQDFKRRTEFIREEGSIPDLRQQPSALLVEADERQRLSEAALTAAKELPVADISLAAKKYWLAGEHWMRLLSIQTSAEPIVRLRYAAALLADRQLGAAERELNSLAPRATGETLAWVHHLLGAVHRRQSRDEQAAESFGHAIRVWPDLIESRLELHELLVAANRIAELTPLWRGCPDVQRLTDVATYARAETAFLNRDWSGARELLSREFRGIPEGDFRFWLLRREIGLAEGIEAFDAGRSGDAAVRMAECSQSMPDYGTGRSEAFGNTDLMFYRWFVALAAGHAWQCQATLTAVLMQEPQPISAAIAYALRIALGQRHPAAEHLRALAGAAKQAAGAVPELRQAALAAADGDYTVFEKLRTHRLHRYRAAFECDVVRDRLRHHFE